jgi:hypothetical protein
MGWTPQTAHPEEFMKQAFRTIAAVTFGSAIALSSSPALAASFKVAPTGQDYTSIQAAVDAASDGDSIIVYPGTYQEVNANTAAVTINKSLKLKAKIKKSDPLSKVIIVPNPGQNHGILVEGTEAVHIDGLQIKNFTVQGFPKNGIWLRYVDNFKLDSNTSIDNLENGFWPTLSANGQVKKNISYGSDDSAMWVEASTNVRVLSNQLYDSVTGMEVTISSDVDIEKNDIHNNTVGVGLYHPNGAGMPIPPGLTPGGWVLKKNHIYDNNRANSASPSSLAGALPPGGGMLVLGVDAVQVDDNLIEDNDFYGIAIVDYCAAVDGGPNDCETVPHIVEGFPEGNRFEDNELNGNGTAPDPTHPLKDYAADFTYILTDIFDPDPSPPYSPVNVLCGTSSTNPGGYTTSGLGVTSPGAGQTLSIRPKC